MACTLICAGCGRKYPDLPFAPHIFKAETFVNPDDETDTYMSIEYEGRVYVPYGTLNGVMEDSSVKECLGFIGEDELSNMDIRIYSLVEDPDCNYLYEYCENSEPMAALMFYRATDTNGKTIDTPNYIGDLGYDYWK